MKNKTFISLLGTSCYQEVEYFLEGTSKNLSTKFIQVALLHFFQDEIKEAYIFVSEKAEKANKENLLAEIEKHNLQSIPIRFIHLPELEKADDIWDIYETIYSRLPENAHLILDITHSFRYMPMVLISLLNYAKFLKNISVDGIYYGNYEKRNNEGKAPVSNLTGLDKIIDWSNAARNILKFGDAETLFRLAEEKFKPINAQTKGKDVVAKNMKLISEFYNDTFRNIKSNRLKEIIAAKKLNLVKEALENLQQAYIPSFLPIINKIKPLFENWQKGDVMNGIRAVEICIDKDWIPQGYTFLQESMINLGLERVGINWNDKEFYDSELREKISKIYNHLASNKFKDEIVDENWKEIIKKSFSQSYFKIYWNLTQKRNDVNHAGMRPDISNYKNLKEILKKNFESVKKLFPNDFH